jgi:DNA-binding transcriptional LysR family regulator
VGSPNAPKISAEHDIIGFASAGPNSIWVLWKDAKAIPVNLSSRLMTNTADVAIAAACDGRGLTRVLSYQIADEVAARDLEIVVDEFTRPVPVHVVHRETGHVSASVRSAVDHLVTGLRGLDVLRPAHTPSSTANKRRME